MSGFEQRRRRACILFRPIFSKSAKFPKISKIQVGVWVKNHCLEQEKIFDLLEKEREKRQKLRRSKQEAGILKSKTSKADKKSKKTVRGDHFKKKFRKTFEILFEEEEQRLKRNLKDEHEKVISYQT